jgi:long-subunit fatty acid transport protein
MRTATASVGLIALLFCSSAFPQISFIDAEFAGAGARALGMGTAFIAMSDDATAAEFNPAGLRFLRRPEFGLQGMYTFDRQTQFLFDSSFPPGAGIDEFKPITKDFKLDYATPSFISFVYPTQDFVVAFSQLTSINQRTALRDEGWYDTSFGSVTETTHLRSRLTGRTTLHNYGVSLAAAPHQKLYVGGSLRYAEFSYAQDQWSETEIFEGIDPRLVYSNYTETHSSDEDGAFNWNSGLIWRVHKYFSLGTVYKSSIPFELKYLGTTVNVDVPRTIGAGIAFYPNDRLRILADWDNANWSEFENNPFENYERDDVNRYHVGGEYHLGVKWDTAWFVRTGYFLEESNALHYVGRTDFRTGQVLAEGIPKGDDIDHVSFGVGMARERFQVDLAADFTRDTMDYILSTVVYF